MSEIKIHSSDLLGEKYYKTIHKSGLTVCVFPKDMTTTYGVLTVNFGGNITEYEKDGKRIQVIVNPWDECKSCELEGKHISVPALSAILTEIS